MHICVYINVNIKVIYNIQLPGKFKCEFTSLYSYASIHTHIHTYMRICVHMYVGICMYVKVA